MKINLSYIKSFLGVFLDSPNAGIDVDDLVESKVLARSELGNVRFDEQFIFHLNLLVESKMISDMNLKTGNLENIGFIVSGDYYRHHNHPMRLTTVGYDFAQSINQDDIFEALQLHFVNSSFKDLVNASKQLSNSNVQSKLSALLC
ncbi:TPA: hypothetical protein ACVU43_003002 [Vibrio parahaemolyticus]